MAEIGKIHQPLHPSVRPKLDPQYAAFHDSHLQYIQPSETFEWNSEVRNIPGMPDFGSPQLDVGSVRDFVVGEFQVRVFTPVGEVPQDGWGVLVWFHGGGWVLGNINSENNFCTVLCKRASCVTVTVDYRLAPEYPFPAATDDAVSALQWVFNSGKKTLNIDPSRIAVGGSSAGANLATVLSLKASTLKIPIPLTFLLLTVPVIDNTATISTCWSENRHAPWLTPSRMTWYRNMYIPNKTDAETWIASPNLAQKQLLAKSPRTWMGVSQMDILAREGIQYAELLKNAGVEVELKVYPGSTHSILALDGKTSAICGIISRSCADNYLGILDLGKELVLDASRALADAFGNL